MEMQMLENLVDILQFAENKDVFKENDYTSILNIIAGIFEEHDDNECYIPIYMRELFIEAGQSITM